MKKEYIATIGIALLSVAFITVSVLLYFNKNSRWLVARRRMASSNSSISGRMGTQGMTPRFSRLTLGISGDPAGLDQIIKQCDKLIDVIHCTEHTPGDTVVRDMVLIKLQVSGGERRTEVLQIIEHFGGKTIDLTENSMIARIEGNSEKVDSAIRLLSSYDIIETVRTGKVVMARGEQAT